MDIILSKYSIGLHISMDDPETSLVGDLVPYAWCRFGGVVYSCGIGSCSISSAHIIRGGRTMPALGCDKSRSVVVAVVCSLEGGGGGMVGEGWGRKNENEKKETMSISLHLGHGTHHSKDLKGNTGPAIRIRFSKNAAFDNGASFLPSTNKDVFKVHCGGCYSPRST